MKYYLQNEYLSQKHFNLKFNHSLVDLLLKHLSNKSETFNS